MDHGGAAASEDVTSGSVQLVSITASHDVLKPNFSLGDADLSEVPFTRRCIINGGRSHLVNALHR